MKIAVLTIGDELLAGKTINTNLAYIAGQLVANGLELSTEMLIADTFDAINTALDTLWPNYDIVITTGGLGPTSDDVTKQTVASYFGKELRENKQAMTKIRELFGDRDIKIPLTDNEQAQVPTDFVVLINNYGTAPGLHYTENGKQLFMLPGVPHEMKALFTEKVLPILTGGISQKIVCTHDVNVFGISESKVGEICTDLDLPPEIKLAFYPQTGRVNVRVSAFDELLVMQSIEVIRKALDGYVWGVDYNSPTQLLAELACKHNIKIATAESCTGGLTAHLISQVDGASNFLLGGIVAYHGSIKEAVLGVNALTLKNHGEVSHETAKEMVQGLLTCTKADIGVSITGIAGPTGGSPEKPVGTVYFGVGTKRNIKTYKKKCIGSRKIIQHQSAEAAIFYLIDFIQSSK